MLFLGDDVEYPEVLRSRHNELLLLFQKNKINKCEKIVCNLNKKDYYVFPLETCNKVEVMD